MKAGPLGIFSAVVASACCVGPLVLIALGLGSLGVGAVLGRYHGWFILAAIGLLTYAWRSYVKEAHRCRAASCEMAQGTITRIVLIVASVIVTVFVGLNVSTYTSQHRTAPEPRATSTRGERTSVVIPVEGMTCFTCEFTVESSLKRLPGVERVDAKVNERVAHVNYDPSQVSLEELIAVINKTGYKARRPSGQGG